MEHISINILRLLLKTASKNQFTTFITKPYTKLAQAILILKASVLHVESIFLYHCVVGYTISTFLFQTIARRL